MLQVMAGRRILPCIFTINFIYRYASSNSGSLLLDVARKKEAVTAYKVLVPNRKLYPWIGRMGVVTCFSVLSFL